TRPVACGRTRNADFRDRSANEYCSPDRAEEASTPYGELSRADTRSQPAAYHARLNAGRVFRCAMFRIKSMFDLVYRFDPAKAASYRTPRTSDEACRLLVQGNCDFAEMTDLRRTAKTKRVIPFDPRAFGWGGGNGGAPVQAPFAAVLGCADARVPTEMVFSMGCNELFVV